MYPRCQLRALARIYVRLALWFELCVQRGRRLEGDRVKFRGDQ